MSPEFIVAIGGGFFWIMGLSFLLFKRLPRRLKSAKYRKKWRELQRLCSKKETWPEAIVGADKLLDNALKKRRKSGKTMGERLVESRSDFSDNDSVWRAHKLAGHIQHSKESNLKESDVKEALVAFRQALMDLRAL